MSVLISLLTNLIPTIVTFFANMAKKLTLTAIIVPIQIMLLISITLCLVLIFFRLIGAFLQCQF
ncbi:hypothetical protein CKA56_14190 [Arcobacter venerupis]|uniref:hypothetical protein n=1 Tax=Arcobacter venerupis TaxID=1054033 RepID=UPI000FEBBDA8|nr:hypothetical protein [Arcobacter venerupis]RWS48387.1 hypothetical protein CKA56_14190 [Arcobacter venerupis]